MPAAASPCAAYRWEPDTHSPEAEPRPAARQTLRQPVPPPPPSPQPLNSTQPHTSHSTLTLLFLVYNRREARISVGEVRLPQGRPVTKDQSSPRQTPIPEGRRPP